jgi:cytochrome d ubiquinol oxidase subunit I
MGLAPLIVLLRTRHPRTRRPDYGAAAQFWARIFAITVAAGVATGIPMEFQFGTTWAPFASFSGGVVGQTLAMEGILAVFLESGFLGLFLAGEHRVSPFLHWLSSVLLAAGALISGFFITATDAWMQHPVGYRRLLPPPRRAHRARAHLRGHRRRPRRGALGQPGLPHR